MEDFKMQLACLYVYEMPEVNAQTQNLLFYLLLI